MSSGKECEIVEVEPGKWVYLLENERNNWDWREGADIFGSFKSEIEASDHLYGNHSNPGGYSTVFHNQVSAELKAMIAARKRAESASTT